MNFDDFPDIRDIFQLSADDDMQNVEFLEEYRLIVETQLKKDKITEEKETADTSVLPMDSIVRKTIICENIGKAAEEKVTTDNASVHTNEELLVIPMDSIVRKTVICENIGKAAVEKETTDNAPLYTNEKLLVLPMSEKRNAQESLLLGIRARNEMCSSIDKSVICEDIAKLLDFIINDEKTAIKRNNKVQFIFACITSFCENYI